MFCFNAALRRAMPTGLALLLLASACGNAFTQTAPRGGNPQPSKAMQMPAADRDALHAALDAYDQGKLQQAEPALRDLASRYPKSYEANEALGSLYAESGDVPRAVPYLLQAAEVAPRQALAHANLGAAYVKLGRNADAVRELQRAAELDPRDGATQSNLGQAYLLNGEPRDAASAFAVAAAAQPQNWQLRYNWALALFNSGQTQQAGAVLQKIPPAAENDQEQSLAGDVDEKLGNYKQAVIHYQAAAQLNPNDANIYTLTLEFLRHWTWDEAIQIARFGESRYPASTHFKVAEGIALYGGSKYAASAAAFSALLAQDPENGMYADLLGRSCSLLAEGEDAGCEGMYAFALKHPQNAVTSVYAATSILHEPAAKQDLGAAATLLQSAIAADPKLPEAYFEMGVLQQTRNQWKESAAMLEKAVQLRPAYPEAHYRLSRAYAHMGERDEAAKQMALQQQYSQQEKDNLNKRMQEIVTFLVKPN